MAKISRRQTTQPDAPNRLRAVVSAKRAARGPPVGKRTAVRTVCLALCVREPLEAVFFHVNSSGKFLTCGRALQHQQANGHLPAKRPINGSPDNASVR